MTNEKTANETSVRIDGEVESPTSFSFADWQAIDAQFQIPDVSQLLPNRKGAAVRLEGLLQQVQPKEQAVYIGLHASHDDFHASVPLAALREQAIIIYARESQPLATTDGGPVRFYIPDHAACHTAEVDECANVKFIDHIEFTAEKGFDNRPDDDEQHEQLHARQ